MIQWLRIQQAANIQVTIMMKATLQILRIDGLLVFVDETGIVLHDEDGKDTAIPYTSLVLIRHRDDTDAPG